MNTIHAAGNAISIMNVAMSRYQAPCLPRAARLLVLRPVRHLALFATVSHRRAFCTMPLAVLVSYPGFAHTRPARILLLALCLERRAKSEERRAKSEERRAGERESERAESEERRARERESERANSEERESEERESGRARERESEEGRARERIAREREGERARERESEER
jgi:hypothetical protein